MGYKLLGFAVWQGGKWYLRRRMRGMARTAAIVGVGAAAVGVLVFAAQRQHSSD